MRVYLIRHSFAVDEARHLPDEFRYLSQEGRRVAREVGRKLAGEGHGFDAMLTSPLVRATQTAEIIAQLTDYVGVIEAVGALAPGLPPRLVAEELPSRGMSIAVVGHEPSIAALGAVLLQRPSFPPLRPGSVALVEEGRARWMLSSELLTFAPIIVQDGWT